MVAGQTRARHCVLAVLLVLLANVAIAASNETSLQQERLAAQQEIQTLLPRYAHASDLISADSEANAKTVGAEYRSLFTQDAKIGIRGQMSVSGPMAWLAVVSASLGPMRGTQHMIGSQVIDIERLASQGGGVATLTSYLQSTQVAASGELSRVIGTYFAKVIHSPESGWQLAELSLQLLAIDTPRAAAAESR